MQAKNKVWPIDGLTSFGVIIHTLISDSEVEAEDLDLSE